MMSSVSSNRLVVPGEIIAEESNGFMAGWGTYSSEGKIISAVAGTIQTIDKLINVCIKNNPYRPEQGDVVIGRIISVEQKNWKVNINSSRDAVLNIVNINLPQGEQRRRNEEDLNMMKSFFSENDLLSGEVLSVHSDGGVTLQTRNMKYGKLKDGILINVNPNLIKKMRIHFLELVNNVKCILGKNGLVWVYFSTIKLNTEYFTDDENKINELNKKEEINKNIALLIILIREIVISLNKHKVQIEKGSILSYLSLYLSRKGCFINNKSSETFEDKVKSLITSGKNESLLYDFDYIKLSKEIIIDEYNELEIIKELNTKYKPSNFNQPTFDVSIIQKALEEAEEDNIDY